MKQEILDAGYAGCIEITGYLECVYSGDTLDSVLAEITENIAKIKQEYIKDYHTRHEIDRDGDYLYLILYRLETDEEYQERLAEEQKQREKEERARAVSLEKKAAKQAKKEAAERAEYERLKQIWYEINW